MNKKVFILIILVLLLTGCKANYVLKYENGKFSEHLEFISEKTKYVEDEAHPTYEALKENNVPAVVDGSEKWIVDQDSDQYDIKISHDLNNSTLDDLTIVDECFSLHTYKEGDKTIYYAAHGDYNCDFLDNGSTFTLETSSEVIDSNATEVDGNKYIWDLNSQKVKENGIVFQLVKESFEKDSKKKKTDSSLIPWYVKLIISVIVIVAVIGGVTYIKNHS
ncbi:MAG: hypothetical protein IKQ35_03890 [Bacilli bacterium]|nr:hypothetical protein [Bacilli bacterium]